MYESANKRWLELTSIAVDSANAAVAELEKQIEGAKADQPLDPIEANIIPCVFFVIVFMNYNSSK